MNSAPTQAIPTQLVSEARVLHIVHVIHRLDVGGLENGLVNLINHLPGRFRHSIVCLTDVQSFQERIEREVNIYELNKREGKDFGVYRRLWRLLRRLGPDIVHTRNLGTLDCVPVAAFAGVPCRIHGEHGWDLIDLHGSNVKYRWLRRLCRPWITRHVAVSKHLAEWLGATLGHDDRVVQLYNGVDTARFRVGSGRESFPNKFRDERLFVVGTVGRMEAVKDPMTLVRAFVRLVEIKPEMRRKLRLVILGDGSLKHEIDTLLATHRLRDLAWIPGNRDDIPELLRGFDLFVLPSLNEGISNTVLEAMASGLAVIATDVGGNPELVIDGETGSLIPRSEASTLADVIDAYAADPARVRREGQAGRVRVEKHFSLDAMISTYAKLYDDTARETGIIERRPV